MAKEHCPETLEIPPPEPSSSSSSEQSRIEVKNGEISDRSSPESVSSGPSLCRNSSISRLNAQAPEFVPRSPVAPSGSNASPFWANSPSQIPPQMMIPAVHVYPPVMSQGSPLHPSHRNHGHFQYVSFVDQQEPAHPIPESDSISSKDVLSEEVTHKIIKQVEYYFSDANLATTDHLMRFISKDPEGFVPISVIASFKKIKAFTSSHTLLAAALQTSSKLVVSEDGKKVRRQHAFTDTDIEDLQSRTVVAENLPEDHSHQNLEKIFGVVGSVKTIRICHPQTSNGGASVQSRSPKIDMLVSNKLHALVEYETVEQAEKAVSELNDERNWRCGLRVRLLLRRMPKSTAQARARKNGHEGENGEEENVIVSEQADDPSQPSEQSHDHTCEENLNDKEGGSKKARSRGRGKARGRGQHHNNNRGGQAVGTPPSNSSIQNDHPSVTKQPPGPRMPDGTRGFTMGRGKPLGAGTT